MCLLYSILHIIIHPAVVKAPVRMRILSDNVLRHKQAILLIKNSFSWSLESVIFEDQWFLKFNLHCSVYISTRGEKKEINTKVLNCLIC